MPISEREPIRKAAASVQTAHCGPCKRQSRGRGRPAFSSDSLCLQRTQLCFGWGTNFNPLHVNRGGQTQGSQHRGEPRAEGIGHYAARWVQTASGKLLEAWAHSILQDQRLLAGVGTQKTGREMCHQQMPPGHRDENTEMYEATESDHRQLADAAGIQPTHINPASRTLRNKLHKPLSRWYSSQQPKRSTTASASQPTFQHPRGGTPCRTSTSPFADYPCDRLATEM
ncbi:uncharacterized protein LOC132510734 [Lagenorhynchus albirostris]|uniref:uncharacterized protein LOC132510734 n=1 Tax=Lagenorhynchus albirostris TaxID=27610 RepID=UPI0028E1BA93|nr:uncharacterized protein LOC132510734 [Lagenorhynchus albirostris]